MLRLLSQELWTLLNSACEQTSGIPKKILDDKAEELRIKNEAQKVIQVSMHGIYLPSVVHHSLNVHMYLTVPVSTVYRLVLWAGTGSDIVNPSVADLL